jgi:hypothetical protein
LEASEAYSLIKHLNSQIMKNILIFLFICLTFSLFAPINNSSIERKGFVFGIGIGGGAISIADSDAAVPFDKAQGGISLPNLKFGWMVNDQLAIPSRCVQIVDTFERHFLEDDGHRDAAAFTTGIGFNWY